MKGIPILMYNRKAVRKVSDIHIIKKGRKWGLFVLCYLADISSMCHLASWQDETTGALGMLSVQEISFIAPPPPHPLCNTAGEPVYFPLFMSQCLALYSFVIFWKKFLSSSNDRGSFVLLDNVKMRPTVFLQSHFQSLPTVFARSVHLNACTLAASPLFFLSGNIIYFFCRH